MRKHAWARRKHGLNKYGKSLVRLPAPRFAVFYNGTDNSPEEYTLRLSDSFAPNAHSDVEVCVRVININPGMSERIKANCDPLGEYTWIVQRVRNGFTAQEAMDALGVPEAKRAATWPRCSNANKRQRLDKKSPSHRELCRSVKVTSAKRAAWPCPRHPRAGTTLRAATFAR